MSPGTQMAPTAIEIETICARATGIGATPVDGRSDPTTPHTRMDITADITRSALLLPPNGNGNIAATPDHRFPTLTSDGGRIEAGVILAGRSGGMMRPLHGASRCRRRSS
jgi:hypothetical protein